LSEDPRHKYHWLPEATNDHFFLSDSMDSDEPEEPTIDPWARPDAIDYNDYDANTMNASEGAAPFTSSVLSDIPGISDIYPDMPTEPCPCCGAALPSPLWEGYICPRCWWEIDPFVSTPTEPSDLNRGLSLYEAQWNVHTFGVSNPAFLDKLVDRD